MKIEKRNETLVLSNDGVDIETYELQKEINFSGLMKMLLSNNLQKKFVLDPYEKTDFNDIENNLISTISEILDKYNEKVDELQSYITTINK